MMMMDDDDTEAGLCVWFYQKLHVESTFFSKFQYRSWPIH